MRTEEMEDFLEAIQDPDIRKAQNVRRRLVQLGCVVVILFVASQLVQPAPAQQSNATADRRRVAEFEPSIATVTKL